MIISVHIPKTAGATFKSFLERHVIVETVYMSKLIVESLVDNIEFDRSYKKSLKISPKTGALHGHFLATDFDEIFKNEPKVVWIRDPIERVISHYYFWCNKKKDNYKSIYREKVFKGESNIIEFAQRTKNLMTIFLNNVPIKNFHFVGLVENFDKSLEVFCREFGFSYSKAKKLNKTPIKENVPDAIRKEISKYNDKDMDIYNEALEVAKNNGYGLNETT